jgi:excisionase family DNA binding protein
MSTEYYTLEKTAEVLSLPTAEVNRMREKSQLRAFRDGSSWKFRKEDVDNHLAETIKNRSKQNASESDFDLLGDDDDEKPTLLADSVSFDAIMEDGLSLGDEMVDTKASKENTDSSYGLALADEAVVDLSLGDDEVALDGTGSSPKLNLAADSGLSLLEVVDDVELQAVEKNGSDAQLDDLDDDDDILALVDAENAEHTSTIAIPVEDDFQLTPSVDGLSEDSDSSSQVIALEEENMFGAPTIMDPAASFPAADTGMPQQPGPFGATSGEFVSQATTFAAGPTVAEPTYDAMAISLLVACAFFLIICGWMSIDLIVHIWSWKEPFVINSTIMDFVAGIAPGLK